MCAHHFPFTVCVSNSFETPLGHNLTILSHAFQSDESENKLQQMGL